MIILGIETSCDETSAAIVKDGYQVLSCTIASSRKDFENTGGVIPENAARKQLESILPTVNKALENASLTSSEIDAIAVTVGPGLLGSLLVGTTTAHVLSSVWKIPLIPVHHTLGHIFSSTLRTDKENTMKVTFPILTLSVSGGHTDLWLRTGYTKGSLLGTTRDDAAGEAFDKGAVLFGFSYPGGPDIEKNALKGNERAHVFPDPLSDKNSLEFSFSGLKTSLKYLLQKKGMLTDIERSDIVASYQFAIVRHLVSRLEHALLEYPDIREIHVVGGVAANGKLRERIQEIASKAGVLCRYPATLRFCTDNAAMIASAAYYIQKDTQLKIPQNGVATLSLQKLLEA